MRNRLSVLVWIALAAFVPGCYTSFSGQGDSGLEFGADDGNVADDAADSSAEAEAEADAEADADAEAEAEADVPTECPPLMDGTWLSWEMTSSGPLEDVDVETPCRLGIVIGSPEGHDVVRLECGTGGMMTTYTIDFFANPRVYLSFWDGDDVTLRLVSDRVWWIDRWFTVRGVEGNLLFAGTNASHLAPWGTEPSVWYAPLGIRAVGGACPAEEAMCGRQERQALEVTFGEESGFVFDGYHGFVGSMITADVHVGTATNYVEMNCDDVPDSWYQFVIVMPPEG